jgi:branched-chain amino acid transport system permease protein
MDLLPAVLINGVVLGLIYALVAVGFSVIYGVARVFVFCHGSIYMLGAICGFYFVSRLGVAYPLALIIAMLGTGAIGLLVERIIRPKRDEPLAAFLIVFGIGMIIDNAMLHIVGEAPHGVARQVPGVIHIFGATITLERLAVILAAIVIILTLHYLNKQTKMGLGIRALAQNNDAALLQGIDVNRSMETTFFVAFAVAGAAGILVAPLFYVDVFLGTPAIIRTLLVVVIGGLGSFPGAIAGGVLLGLLESFGDTYLGGIGPLLGFLAVIVVLLVRPQGLLGHERE